MATLDYQSPSDRRREWGRRFWLASSAGRAMAGLARDLGGSWHYDADLRRHRAAVPIGRWSATVEFVPAGRSLSTVLTEVRLTLAGRPGCQVMARPAGWRDRVGNLLGFDTARTGDAAFDRRFVLIGADVPRIVELFAAGPVRRGLLGQPDAVLVVGGAGDRRTVTVARPGHVADAERLRPSLGLVGAVADRLAELGLAG